MRNIRRKQVADHKNRNYQIFLTISIMVFIYLTINIVVGENGLLRYLELKSMRSQILAETTALNKQNADIRSQIEMFHDEPNVAEEMAREYGMTKEGEMVFKFEDEE